VGSDRVGVRCPYVELACLTLAFLLLTDADVPRVNSLRSPANPSPSFPSDEEIPLFPNAPASQDNAQSPSQPHQKLRRLRRTPRPGRFKALPDPLRLGEFAKAIKSLPAGKEGFHVNVGKPLETELLIAPLLHAPGLNTGDKVQITKLEFRDRQIVVRLNAAARPRSTGAIISRSAWGAAVYPPMQPASTQDPGPAGDAAWHGQHDFPGIQQALAGYPPDELKQFLSPFLNFAKSVPLPCNGSITLPRK